MYIKTKSPDPRFHTEKSGIGNDREKEKKLAVQSGSPIRSRSSSLKTSLETDIHQNENQTQIECR